MFNQLKLYQEALQNINTTLEINPNYFKALRARARIYVGLELFERAVEEFADAIRHCPPNIDPAYLMEVRQEMTEVEKTSRKQETERDHYRILGA